MTETLQTQAARFAFIKAGWHSDIVDRALEGFIAEIERLGHRPSSIDVYDVPGAFEIPLHAKKLAGTDEYDAIIGAALIVDGGIYRHDFVAETVVRALMQVQLETEIPMISMMLTPHHFHDHAEHQSFFDAHFVKKGAEAAQAAHKTVASLARLAALPSDRARRRLARLEA